MKSFLHFLLFFGSFLVIGCNKNYKEFTYQNDRANHQVVIFEDSTFVELVISNDSSFKYLGYWNGTYANNDTLTLTITRQDFNILTNIASQHFLVKGSELMPLDTLKAFEPLIDRTIYDKRETSLN